MSGSSAGARVGRRSAADGLEAAQIVAEPELPLILAVDDDADILAIVVYRLEHSGYRVITAGDGEEALHLARAERPVLAVVDVIMPSLDGYELTRLLRSHDETREMSIILLTACVQPQDVDRALQAGADDYLRKPFSPRELLSRVHAALGARGGPTGR